MSLERMRHAAIREGAPRDGAGAARRAAETARRLVAEGREVAVVPGIERLDDVADVAAGVQ